MTKGQAFGTVAGFVAAGISLGMTIHDMVSYYKECRLERKLAAYHQDVLDTWAQQEERNHQLMMEAINMNSKKES